MKAIDMRSILLIISSFQYQRPQQERVRHQHWKNRSVSLLLKKLIKCWAIWQKYHITILSQFCVMLVLLFYLSSTDNRISLL